MNNVIVKIETLLRSVISVIKQTFESVYNTCYQNCFSSSLMSLTTFHSGKFQFDKVVFIFALLVCLVYRLDLSVLCRYWKEVITINQT